jgi:hypothetical protein
MLFEERALVVSAPDAEGHAPSLGNGVPLKHRLIHQ